MGRHNQSCVLSATSLSNIQVKFSVYLQYMRAIGWGYTTMSLLFYCIQNVAVIGQNMWLSDWTNDAVDYNNMTYPAWKRDTRIGVFGALGVVQGKCWLILSYLICCLLLIQYYLAF